MSVITVSRLDGSRGNEVAALVAERLGFRLVDRSLMNELIVSYDLLSSIGKVGDGGRGSDEKLAREVTEGLICHLAFHEDIVLLGYGGQFLFRGWPSCFHVRIIAGLEYRLTNFRYEGRGDPAKVLKRHDAERKRLVSKYHGEDLTRPDHYDLTIRVDRLGIEGAVEAVARACAGADWFRPGDVSSIRDHGRKAGVREITVDPLPPTEPRSIFAHPSEQEFARILDFYRIRWEYEPRTFPIEWWPDGRVRESFSPDFYLPDMNLYIELTTMKQSLVTKKNRKVRRFRELYPEERINIFYRRDFRKLAVKYGME